MNIGEVAEASGLPAKTIRYYEDIGLIRPARGGNGYRVFSDADRHKLIFLTRARGLGFSVAECRTLLSLYEDKSRASSDVRELAEGALTRIEAKMAELQQMRGALSELVHRCHGDTRPDCPILEGLASA
ncbi:Cu(I)-responsive transcriptional regulator [Pseudoroseicyclus sp. CXY001]|uniref:Cu(I)-responsive transcriptional regulator n=1 Tax=Pseudoroseicyclus sp. CXY001 TaxID=3242492 RepID=UPI0035714EEF